jgi:hypothetical protein
MGMGTDFYEKVNDIKRLEQKELVDALRLYGDKIDNGFEVHFEHDNPIIACYGSEDPYDVVIMSVRVDDKGIITILGEDKNYRGEPNNIYVYDIFAGQLSYITEEICYQNS